MKDTTEKIHRLLAPRLIVTIGTTSQDGRKNIIPINNITSISTDPGMVLIAVYHPWITAGNLKSARGFTVSIPSKDQLELIWKLGQKYSGYESKLEKTLEFKNEIDLNFSKYGPVLKDALGWIECEIVSFPDDRGGNHLLVIGSYTKATANENFFNKENSPINNPKPIMQWEGNNFSEASDVFNINYYKKSETIK